MCYVDAVETLFGVSDRPLEGRLVPQKVLGVEASGRWARPVMFLVLVYVPLLPGFAPARGDVRCTFGHKANGTRSTRDRFELLVFALR